MMVVRATLVLLASVALLGGCASPVPVAGAAPEGPTAAAAAEAVSVSLAAASDNTASLRFSEPKAAYALLDSVVPTVHRWVPGDIVQYEVAFKKQIGEGQYEATGFAEVVVPRKGQAPKTTAVFTKVPWGSVYRAFVVAKGNVGGDLNAKLEVLNDVAATADFDFTQAQDTPSAVTKSVQVVFNAVTFSGTGSVAIQQPAEGVFANPTGEIQATASALPQ